MDESGSHVKGVRLQGFKGFKLNRNAQILYKPAFNKKASPSKPVENIKPVANSNSSPSTSLATKASISPTSPSLLSKIKIATAAKTTKTFEHKSVMDEIMAEHRKVENVKKLFASLEKSPKQSRLSQLINSSPPSPSSEVPDRTHQSLDKDQLHSRSKLPSYERVRQLNSSSDHSSSREQRSRHSDHSSSYRQSPKRHRRSRSRDNFRLNHERRRSRSRERRRSRERHRSRERQNTSRKRSHDRKDPRRSGSRLYKRKASVSSSSSSSSSSSDTSDDDELMKRTREKRMRRSKSPETYSVKKRMRTDATEGSCEEQEHHKTEAKSANKPNEKHKIKLVGAPSELTADVEKKSRIKTTMSKEKNLTSPKDEKTNSTNSVVPLASIGCWLSEEEDAEYEVSIPQGEMKDNPVKPNESSESSPSQDSQRNVFDSLMNAEEHVSEEEEIAAKVTTEHQPNHQAHEEESIEESSTSNRESEPTFLPESLKETNLKDILDCAAEKKATIQIDHQNVSLSETNLNDSIEPKSLPIACEVFSEPVTLEHDSFVDETKHKSVDDIIPHSSPTNQIPVDTKEKTISRADGLPEKPAPTLSSHNDLKSGDYADENVFKDDKCNSISSEKGMSAIITNPIAPTFENPVIAKVSVPREKEKPIPCRTTFVHPVKKRYQEWFKSLEQAETPKPEQKPACTNADGAKIRDGATENKELPIQQCTVDTTVPAPVAGDRTLIFNEKCTSSNYVNLPSLKTESTSGQQLNDMVSGACTATALQLQASTENKLSSGQTTSVLSSDACTDNSSAVKSCLSDNVQNEPKTDTSVLQLTSCVPTYITTSHTEPSKPSVLPKKRTISVSEQFSPPPPSQHHQATVTNVPPPPSQNSAKPLMLDKTFQQHTLAAVESSPKHNLLPGQNSPESPMFRLGQDSPGPAYTMSDDDSCFSDIDDMPPVEIRIPIDNEECMDYDPPEESQDAKGHITVPQTEPVAANNSADKMEPSLPDNEGSGERLMSDGSMDDVMEARRRSTRIKTKMKTMKKPVFRASSLPTPSGETVPAELTKESDDTSQSAIDHVVDSQPISAAKSPATDEKATEDIVPPSFDRITENVYLFEKKKSRARKEIRRMLCECVGNTPEGKPPCGETCLNRLLMIECSARCPFGDICTNKMFQRRQYLQTEVFQTSWKGWGLQAAEFLPPGKLVMEYCGEVLDPPEFYRRSQMYAEQNQQHFYFMALSQDEIIDATYKGNNSRFINHSCNPNCETQKWTVNGRLRVGFFTLRDIPKGEEITFDYQFARYGKEAQVCYCGSANCRGYLGKPPSESDDVTPAWVGGQSVAGVMHDVEGGKEKKAKPRKDKYQDFKENTLESEISRLSGGLKTTKEVLLLSRLMVRSDTAEERMMCLKVLRRSDNQTCLRSFLQFHGLPLLWSWMVDVSGSFSAPSSVLSASNARLKVEILQTLAMLPITNKNILEDSKVLSMVKRWAEEESNAHEEENTKPSAQDDLPTLKDFQAKDSDSGDTEGDVEKNEAGKVTKSSTEPEDEAKAEKDQERNAVLELSYRVLSLTAQLLTSWKDLKEIYRIPKKSAEKPQQGGDSERSIEDRTSSQTSSPSLDVLDATRSKEDREKSPHRSKNHYERENSRDRSRDQDRERRSRRSPRSKWKEEDAGTLSWLYNSESSHPSRLSRKEHRIQFERDMRQRDQMKNEIKEAANKSLTIQPPLTSMTSIPSLTHSVVQPTITPKAVVEPLVHTPDTVTFTPSGYSGNLIQINPTPVTPSPILYPSTREQLQQSLNFVATQSMLQATTALQPGYINSAPQQGKPISVIGVPPPVQDYSSTSILGDPYSIQHQTPHPMQLTQPSPAVSATGVTILGYQGENAIVLLTPEQLKELTEMLALKSVQQQTAMQTAIMTQQTLMQPTMLQQQPVPESPIPIAQLGMPIVQSAIPIAQPSVPIAQSSLPIAQSSVPIAQSVMPIAQPIQPITQSSVPVAQSSVLIAPATAQVVQPEPPIQCGTVPQPHNELPLAAHSAFNPTPPSRDPSETRSLSGSIKSPPRDPRPPRLPPNWKTASDADGCVYYYHVITRQTQWEAPTWDGSEEDMMGKKGADMEISSPNPEEGNKKTDVEKLTATAVIASGAEQAKKARETFRKAMSHHVVHCLSAYRKPDCKVGRITSTEEFKKLARKLTHNILQKEIKQVQVWEDLECNANVKHKAKEYVRKYMVKMGPVCKIRDEDNLK